MSKWQEELEAADKLWSKAESMQKSGNKKEAATMFKEAAKLYKRCLEGQGYNYPSPEVQEKMQKRAAYSDSD